MTEPTPTGRAEARPWAANVGSHFSATGLDSAIDRVAARLVALPEDAALLPRMLARLPERASSPSWIAMPVQLAAGAALVLMAFVFARPARELAPMALAPVAMAAPDGAHLVAPVREPVVAAVRRLPTPGSRPPAVVRDRPDHERSLMPVEPLQALAFESIAPAALEPDATAVLAPLVLTELPLAGESSPHHW